MTAIFRYFGWPVLTARLVFPTAAKFAADSPLEGTGFEPSVPLPRLSSIRTVGAEINRAKYGCLSARPRVRCLCPPGKTQHLLPKSVFDRPGSDRWNLASTTFPDAGPMVRIRFPPAGSPLRTSPGLELRLNAATPAHERNWAGRFNADRKRLKRLIWP